MTTEYTSTDHLRLFLSENRTIVLAVLILLAAVGAGMVYLTHVDSAVDYEEHTVADATTTSEYDYSATVREENTVFPVGTELEDRSYFFTRISPVLDGTYTATYATDDGELDATTELVLVLEASRDGETLWQDEENLATERGSDGSIQAAFSLNVTEIRDRLNAIEQDLGTVRDADVSVLAQTTYHGTLDGEDVRETVTHELSIDPGEEIYHVESGTEPNADIERTERRAVAVDHGLLRSVGSVLLLVVPLIAVGTIVIADRSGRLTPTNGKRQSLSFQRQRRAFDDWISRGRVSTEDLEQTVEMESLEDLVDVAIDGDNRVIEATDEGWYCVLTGDVLYTFTPPHGDVPAESGDDPFVSLNDLEVNADESESDS